MTTQIELADHLDISSRHVRNLQDAGVFERGASLDDARVAYIRHLRETAAGRAVAGDLDLGAERARLAKLQADKIEFDLEVKRGGYASIAETEQAWSEIMAASRAKFLTLPERAALAVQKKSEDEAERVIRDMVYEALTELSRWRPDGYEEYEGEE